MRIRITMLLLFILTFVPHTGAEERCLSHDTPRECLRRILAARVYDNAVTDLGNEPVAPADVASPARSATKDFTTPFTAHADTATPRTAGKSLTIETNPFAAFGGRPQLNLQTTFTDPAVSDAVRTALASDPRLPALEHSLRRSDDVAGALTFNFITQGFGRDFAEHRRLLEATLRTLAGEALPQGSSIPPDKLDVAFAQLYPDAVARIAAMSELEAAAANALPPSELRLSKDFARLVSRQSQLYVTAGFHHRNLAIGSRETTVGLTWEIGRNNLAGFRRGEGRDCEAHGTCLAALNDYAARAARVRGDDRIALSITYKHSRAGKLSESTPATFDVAAADTLAFAATYGRPTSAILPGGSGRVDVTFAVETTTNRYGSQSVFATALASPVAQVLAPPHTPFAVAATATQSVRNHVWVPVSLVYSDRTQWLPGTAEAVLPISPPKPGNGHTTPFSTHDHQLVLHVGLLYRFPTFTAPRDPSSKCCCGR